MKVNYSFVCESANVSQNGNLNVLGIFRNISSQMYPFTFTKMFYVTALEFNPDEIGTHKFRLSFINDDGQNILPNLEGDLRVGENNLHANLLLAMDNIVFSKPGTYEINMFLNNKQICSDNLNITP